MVMVIWYYGIHNRNIVRPGYFNFQMAVFTPPDNLRFVDKNKKNKNKIKILYFIIEMTRNTEIQIKICPPPE